MKISIVISLSAIVISLCAIVITATNVNRTPEMIDVLQYKNGLAYTNDDGNISYRLSDSKYKGGGIPVVDLGSLHARNK